MARRRTARRRVGQWKPTFPLSFAADPQLHISSGFFTWSKDTKTFSAEASELEAEMTRVGWRRLERRNGQDGFWMISTRTGNKMWFRRHVEHRDREDELLYVEFLCDRLPGVKVHVYND